MSLIKFTVWCVKIIALIQSSYSLDVKCVFETNLPFSKWMDSWCTIRNLENFQPGDQLNFVEIEHATEIKRIYLSNAPAMTTFPNEIFDQLPSLEEICIENVGIQHFTKLSFEKPRENISQLFILKTKLKVISANWLHFLPNLHVLCLFDNSITTIEEDALASSNLMAVYLNGTKLTTLKKHYFQNIPKLLSVGLTGSLIEEIEEGAFDFPGFLEIYLHNNRLKTLPVNLFANAPKLLKLYIESNRLPDIAAIEKARNLYELNLRNNPTLKNVNVSPLFEFSNLRFLRLANTGVTMDTTNGPLNSTTLNYLDLRRNNLTDSRLLHHLSGLKNLRDLYLEDNKLTKLDNFDKIQEYFPNLKSISLGKNPWDSEWEKSAQKVCSERNIGHSFASFDDDY